MAKMTLRAARVNAKLSRDKAAAAIGVSASTIKNWEIGKSSPTVDMVPRICSAYNTTYDDIFFTDEVS